MATMFDKAFDFAWQAQNTIPRSIVGGTALAAMPLAPMAAGMYYSGYSSYRMNGWLSVAGFEPGSMTGNGINFKGWGMDWKRGQPENWYTATAEAEATNLASGKMFTGAGLKARLPGLGGALTGGMNAFMMYEGYKEGGLGGAYDALSLNVGIEAAMVHWAWGNPLTKIAGQSGFMKAGVKTAGSPLVFNTSAGIFRGLGATVGGLIGQSAGLATGVPMMGTFGATAGAFIGANPMGAMASNPILTTGAVLGLAAGVASYGAYNIVKAGAQAGYAHRQSQRGVNTDGDMGAFMTQNAMTMRERSVQAIARSGMNSRSAIGMEAGFMHTAKNYNSRYR